MRSCQSLPKSVGSNLGLCKRSSEDTYLAKSKGMLEEPQSKRPSPKHPSPTEIKHTQVLQDHSLKILNLIKMEVLPSSKLSFWLMHWLNVPRQPVFPSKAANGHSQAVKFPLATSEAPKSSKQEIFPPAVHAWSWFMTSFLFKPL